MTLTRVRRLLATGVVSSALAAAGLAITPAEAQAAAPGTSASYTCASTLPIPAPLNALLVPSFTVPAVWSADTLPELITSVNLPVPAGIPVAGTLDLNNLSSAGFGGLLTGLTVTLEGTLSTVLGAAGLDAVAVPLTGAFSQFNAGVATFNGALGSFTPTDAGDLPIPVPTSFDFGVAVPLLSTVGYHCTLNDAARTSPMTTLHVLKQSSSMKAKVVTKKVHQGAKGKVKVTVTATGSVVGKVVAKLKGKTVGAATLKGGKATLKIKKLTKLGVSRIKLVYAGNSSTSGASKTVKITVVA